MTDPGPVCDEATAYHEAGHAVAALALGRPVLHVSARPDREFLGLCDFHKGVHRPSEDWLEREALISLGGPAAELIHTGAYDPDAAAHDFDHVRELTKKAKETMLEPARG